MAVTYTIRKNRIRSGYYPGFDLGEDGVLRSSSDTDDHYLYLRAIDSGVNDSEWGRLQIFAECDEKIVSYVYVAAMNEDSFLRKDVPTKIQDFLCDEEESHGIKKEFFKRVGAERIVNKHDILLYEQKGRYLYLMFEFVGEGACSVSSMRIDMQGDNFMHTFPGIYQERNSFFHRYMSIFSSMYNDFEGEIGKLPSFLDVDTCPADFLPVYASWMGIDVGEDFLDESILRPLVKEAYSLNKMKGTKAAMEKVSQIVLGEVPQILERNAIGTGDSPEQTTEFEKLYGDSPYDVTVLVKNELSQTTKSRLLFLLNQFKPVRARLHVICLKQNGTMDDYAYLDMNAAVAGKECGKLDSNQALDNTVLLKE